jgi:hypothetical protein
MAAVQLCGWETGDLTEAGTTSGGGTVVTVSSAIKRSGSYALRCNPGTGTTGYVEFKPHDATGAQANGTQTNAYCRFYLYIAALPAATKYEFLFTVIRSSTGNTGLMLDSSGKLKVDSSGTLGPYALSTGQWYRIEVRAGANNNAADPWEVLVDGASYLSGTHNSSGAAKIQYVRIGKYVNWTGGAYDCYIDDFLWSDSGYPGEGQVLAMLPDGDSAANAGWTASAGNKHQCVDEIPVNDDTDYLSTSTSTDAYTATLQSTSLAGVSGVLNGVKVLARARVTSGGGAFRVRVRSGSSNSDNASDSNIFTTYTTLGRVLPLDPTDSSSWTTAKLDSLEVGIVSNNTNPARCTWLGAMVDFTASSLPAFVLGLRGQAASGTVDLAMVAEGDGQSGMGGVPKIVKGGAVYDLYLVETTDPDASPFRVQTSAGVKAIRLAT